MPNHEAVAFVSLAEAHLLAVLQDVVFVGIAGILNDVCHTLLVDGWHFRHLGWLRQGDEVNPSCRPAFVSGIGRRYFADFIRTIVAAGIEHVPVLACRATAILGVIEVGIAEAMAELVARRTNAFEGRFVLRQLVGDSIGVDIDIVQSLASRT